MFRWFGWTPREAIDDMDCEVAYPDPVYTFRLERDGDDGFLVTCREIPELTTFGYSVDEALENARGAFSEAMAARGAEED